MGHLRTTCQFEPYFFYFPPILFRFYSVKVLFCNVTLACFMVFFMYLNLINKKGLKSYFVNCSNERLTFSLQEYAISYLPRVVGVIKPLMFSKAFLKCIILNVYATVFVSTWLKLTGENINFSLLNSSHRIHNLLQLPRKLDDVCFCWPTLQ